ncbi:28128_t:CDS:2 [Dentiscutata erythropus]|uniref:28128_t:CDS:1 n=1 Tax=Dentiscutata erythropus TaxID=1348616 RepID=A0A9N9AFA6_9GLOM|nr:28128_t:CDS:2 [Dentiscutata erythropus]
MATTNEGSEFNINSPLVIALVAIIIAVVVIGVIVVVFLILRYQNSASTKTRGLKTRIGPESRDNGHTHKKRDSTGMIFDIEGKEESFEESYAEGAVGHQQQLTPGRSLPVRSQTIYGSKPPSTSTITLQSSTIQEYTEWSYAQFLDLRNDILVSTFFGTLECS